MSDASVKITHAVPVEVQRVLDRITEDNWYQDGAYHCGGKSCFYGHASKVFGVRASLLHDGSTIMMDVGDRCVRVYGKDLALVNDTASSLSDFKQKIIALYPASAADH